MRKQLGSIFLLPLIVVSTTAPNRVETRVSQQGSGQVQVETNVKSENSQSVYVDSDGSVKKTESNTANTRIEIDVNGNKRVIESDKPGNYSLQYKDGEYSLVATKSETAGSALVVTTGLDETIYNTKIKPISLGQYISHRIKDFISQLTIRIFGR